MFYNSVHFRTQATNVFLRQQKNGMPNSMLWHTVRNITDELSGRPGKITEPLSGRG